MNLLKTFCVFSRSTDQDLFLIVIYSEAFHRHTILPILSTFPSDFLRSQEWLQDHQNITAARDTHFRTDESELPAHWQTATDSKSTKFDHKFNHKFISTCINDFYIALVVLVHNCKLYTDFKPNISFFKAHCPQGPTGNSWNTIRGLFPDWQAKLHFLGYWQGLFSCIWKMNSFQHHSSNIQAWNEIAYLQWQLSYL